MGSVLSSTFTAITFALANRGGAAAPERKRFDLSMEKNKKAINKWNQQRIERLDFINMAIKKKKQIHPVL